MNHKFKKEEKHTYIHDLFLPKSPGLINQSILIDWT